MARTDMMLVREQLVAANSKPDALRSIAQAFVNAPDFANILLRLTGAPEPSVSDGASWILKDAIAAGLKLTKAQSRTYADNALSSDNWATALHFCQSIDGLRFDAGAAIAERLNDFTTHERPFVRAWALHALCALADRDRSLAPLARAAYDAAKNDPSAAVRARRRNMRAPGGA